MNLQSYRDVLAVRDARTVLVLALLVRVPLWASGVLLTLHVVGELGRTYGQAGLVGATATVAVAVSGPWRGRLLDRVGLRRTVLPSVLVQVACWSVAPWVPYVPLLLLAGVAGLFVVPTFSVVRQVLLGSVPVSRRRSALALDSMATELSFMAGPALGVWLAVVWDTGWALFACQMASAAAGLVLWLLDPPLRAAPEVPVEEVGEAALADSIAHGSRLETAADPQSRTTSGRRPWRGFVTGPVAAVYLAAGATTVVLTGTDVAVVAALRSMGAPGAIGGVLALWGLGSLLGGLVYGAWHRSYSVFWLLAALALTTAPVALSAGVPALAVLLTVCGVFCAPTITATVEHLSRLVPERFRGEMMGWHGSAMTAGSALGAPIAGFAIDLGGWRWGFLVGSGVGLLVAVLGLAVSRRGRSGRAFDSAGGAPAATLGH